MSGEIIEAKEIPQANRIQKIYTRSHL